MRKMDKKKSMMCSSTPNSILFVIMISIIFLGCDNDNYIKKSITQEVCENTCKSIILDSNCSQKSKVLAEKVLAGWSDTYKDSMPYLLHVAYHKEKDDCYFLALTMSDEEEDIEGLIIREKDSDANVLVEEKYPYFIWYSVGSFRYIPFSERKANERKDAILWDQYLRSSETKYQKPPLYITIPHDNMMKVEIAVYDKKGNVSDYAPLESFIYRSGFRNWDGRTERGQVPVSSEKMKD